MIKNGDDAAALALFEEATGAKEAVLALVRCQSDVVTSAKSGEFTH